MNDQELIAIAEQLEVAADAAAAKLRFHEENPPQSISLAANRAGFIRLAAVLLRTAVQTLLDGERGIHPSVLGDLYQHVAEKKDRRLLAVLRMESWPAPSEPVTHGRPPSWKDRIGLFGCGLVAFGFIFFFIIGVGATIGALFAK